MEHLNVIGKVEFTYIGGHHYTIIYPHLFLNESNGYLFLDVMYLHVASKLTKDYKMTDERLYALRDLKNILETWV